MGTEGTQRDGQQDTHLEIIEERGRERVGERKIQFC